MGPVIKVRFMWDDIVVYYLSFGVFAAAAIVGSILSIRNIGPRVSASSVFALLLAGPIFAFYLDGGMEIQLMRTILLYSAVSIIIVIYPWNEESLNSLLQALAIGGSIISVHTMIYFGNDNVLVDSIRAGLAADYLHASFAMGVGVICATYFLVKNFSVLSIGIFGLNWLGIAVGRGRGAFFFCVVVAILYLLVAMNSRIAKFGRQRKTLMFILILSFIPIVFQQVMKMGRMRDGLAQILFAPDVEAATSGRGTAFSQGVDRFLDNPLFGNGLGAYADNGSLHPHNLFVSWAVDSGIVGVVFLALFFLVIAIMFFKAIRLSDSRNINIVYAMGALCAYMFLNFMKSNDPYQTRELYTLSALPVAAYVVVARHNWNARRGVRRRESAYRSSSEARRRQ